MGSTEFEDAKRNRERIEAPRREESIVAAYNSGELVDDICKRFARGDSNYLSHAELYNILHKYKVPLRSNDPNHPASSLETRANAKEEQISKPSALPPPVAEKVYHCKYEGCDFSIADRYALTSHYNSKHSYHHRIPKEQTVVQPINTTEKKETSEHISKIRKAFKWLVSEGIEPSYEVADELLAKYLQEEPDITMTELKEYLNANEFNVEDLRRANFGVYIRELLDSMPDFKKQEDGNYKWIGTQGIKSNTND